MSDWTVDTWVLYVAGGSDWDAAGVLQTILRRRHYVMFDHEGHIEDEYRRCLRALEGTAGGTAVAKWFVEIVGTLAYKQSGILNRRDQDALAALAFDRDDWPFVCVASRSTSGRLLAEESDYSVVVCEYLTNVLGVRVLGVEGALAELEV